MGCFGLPWGRCVGLHLLAHSMPLRLLSSTAGVELVWWLSESVGVIPLLLVGTILFLGINI